MKYENISIMISVLSGLLSIIIKTKFHDDLVYIGFYFFILQIFLEREKKTLCETISHVRPHLYNNVNFININL